MILRKARVKVARKKRRSSKGRASLFKGVSTNVFRYIRIFSVYIDQKINKLILQRVIVRVGTNNKRII